MSNDKNSLTNAFDLTPIVSSNEIIVQDAPLEEADSYDMETARQNMHHLLQKGDYALSEMIEVAKLKQEARSFEVVATLIKTLAEVNKDLILLQEKKKQLSIKDEVPDKVVNSTTQNLFVGSTEELMKLMNKINK